MTQDWIKEVQKRVQKAPVAGGRSSKWNKISFEDLVFLPAQLKKRPVDYYREQISAKTVIGKLSQKPIELGTPIIVGAMSFGALTKGIKIALAKAATIAGTLDNTGEGGMLEEQREFAKYLIVQYSTGRFGITDEVLKKADAVEIKIGQGAKPGAGGFLPGFKVTEEIARIRNMPVGKDIHSPAAHPDIFTIEDLKNRILELREKINGKPIILKLGACGKEDVMLAIEAGPDIIAVDGMGGGTGASAQILMDEVGLPTIAALAQAREVLDEMQAPQELWIGGGLNTGGDMAKALALGADAVFVGTALLAAMGASDVGLEFKEGLSETDKKAQKIASFIRNCAEEIKMISGACGENNVHNLNKEHLRALNSEMARIAKVKLVSE